MRILGFGRYFAGLVPDPVTDLTVNPAYLKTFGEDTNSYNTPQVYSMMRAFSTTALAEQIPDMEFYESEELVSIYALYPKIGLACRFGAWQRLDLRSLYKYDKPELWPYGQAGFLGSLAVMRWVKIGAEYNYSWNNQPDWIFFAKDDSLGHSHTAAVTHSEWSNEVGFGALISDNKSWQLSLSCKKNWEADNFKACTTHYFWPKAEQTVYIDHHEDFQLNTKIRYSLNKLKITLGFNYLRKDIEHGRFAFYGDQYHTSIRPAIGVLYYPFNNSFVVASITYAVNKGGMSDDTWINDRKVIGLAGFETRFTQVLTFRFGSTLIYTYKYEIYHDLKNELCFGIDITPHDKLTLNFATINPLEYRLWFFGLNFAL